MPYSTRHVSEALSSTAKAVPPQLEPPPEAALLPLLEGTGSGMHSPSCGEQLAMGQLGLQALSDEPVFFIGLKQAGQAQVAQVSLGDNSPLLARFL
mmetsp:Transcript_4867/g.13286  ORF Transcript_4867/g.13286 Transcript_4867/m.13286 type:complete len:96 (-) Transcript_4867:1796-2083(-)